MSLESLGFGELFRRDVPVISMNRTTVILISGMPAIPKNGNQMEGALLRRKVFEA